MKKEKIALALLFFCGSIRQLLLLLFSSFCLLFSSHCLESSVVEGIQGCDSLYTGLVSTLGGVIKGMRIN